VAHPGIARGLEQDVGAIDVGGDELARRLDGTVHVGLRREVDHRVAVLDGAPDRVTIRDVGLDQLPAVL
jgi:hypothetical protein